jgi:isopropylmalate/homocitrate/citramalate synthase
MENEKIKFVDCTLRDGEQAPGVCFTLEEKLAIADLLDAAGVDMLDAGMPSVSAEERKTLEALLGRGYHAKVAGTVRALKSDIDLAAACGLREVFLFMPVSPQHLKIKFGIDLKEASFKIEQAVDQAIAKGLRVSFVAEDTVRADPSELAPLFDRIQALGVSCAIVCDTVGVMRPDTMEAFVGELRGLMNSDLPLGVHCHNDYGLATANTLSAVVAGCSIVTATVNGLGERAGNAPLEEIICALDDLHHLPVHIRKSLLPRLCEEVAKASGVFFMPTKPIVGLNVFRHESGVHVDGMLKDPSTYESIKPESLGCHHQFLLGKHSGRGLVEKLLARRGMELLPETVGHILERVKRAKESRSKAPFAEMWERLKRFWSEHLSFSEEEFWGIVEEELEGIPGDFAAPEKKPDGNIMEARDGADPH